MAVPPKSSSSSETNSRLLIIKPTGHSEAKSSVFRWNDGTREAFSGDRSVKLTKKEFNILRKLVSQPGCVVERDELLAQVWGPEVHVAGRTIDAHMVKLRRKMRCLGDQAPAIETVWALGYRLRG